MTYGHGASMLERFSGVAKDQQKLRSAAEISDIGDVVLLIMNLADERARNENRNLALLTVKDLIREEATQYAPQDGVCYWSRKTSNIIKVCVTLNLSETALVDEFSERVNDYIMGAAR